MNRKTRQPRFRLAAPIRQSSCRKETCMLRRLVLVGTLALPFIATTARTQEALPLPVFVTAQKVPLPPTLTAEQHGAAIKAAEKDMFGLAERMRKEHGNKQQEWPPEAVKAVEDAEDKWTTAKLRGYYETPETQIGLDDSVRDFSRAADKSKVLRVESTAADQASLVVTITNRRYTPSSDVTGDRYFIRFRLSPGGKMTGEQFLERTRGYKWKMLSTELIARPKDASGFVDLQAGSMASYKVCAGMVRAIVENFIRQRLAPTPDRR
jgi:hypothetical protein